MVRTIKVPLKAGELLVPYETVLRSQGYRPLCLLQKLWSESKCF
jgi:hypothetical protein